MSFKVAKIQTLKREVDPKDKAFRVANGSLFQAIGRGKKNSDYEQVIYTMWSLIKDRFLQVCRKPAYSRGIQSILKWGDDKYKNLIFEIIENHIITLCIDSHSYRIIEKLFTYGDSEIRNKTRNIILEKSEQVVYSKFGSRVFNHVFSEKKNLSESYEILKNKFLYKFLGTNLSRVYDTKNTFKDFAKPFTDIFASIIQPDVKLSILSNCQNVIQKYVDNEILDKAFIHTVIWTYISCCVLYYKMDTIIPQEKTNKDNLLVKNSLNETNSSKNNLLCLDNISEEGTAALTSLLEQILEGSYHLLSTKEGVNSLIVLLGFAKAQQKKKLLKSIKKDILQLAENPIDYALLLRLLAVVDDTKILKEIIWNSLITDNNIIPELLSNPYTNKLVLYPLTRGESKRFFNQYELWVMQLRAPATLKLEVTRKEEMLVTCFPTLINTLTKNRVMESTLLNTNSKDTLLAIIYTIMKSEFYIKTYLNDLLFQIISSLNSNYDILKDNIGHRTIVGILKILTEFIRNNHNDEIIKINEEFKTKLFELIISKDMNELLSTKAVFIIVEMIGENSELADNQRCQIWRLRIKDIIYPQIKQVLHKMKMNKENTTGIELLEKYLLKSL
ncbi:uncharacterized protein CMU_039190 [Cryptosporidium muris RN66]|uniref:PUM-HD domain-containing protein n=1 Tax=Cryptosporidium muris (strain RN66) TaxID=441375 RepID=B6A9G1_CRYMR|nr:uncharacterized protein CMU_039190 [Cryptosporidium muris RN66]EEA04852.1 hypothetical protein, conserved [Cryptosporidium muris RN66]|eukprot:XP_002139201.1 hypothetical protein [Cryptosporidium muris RN66]